MTDSPTPDPTPDASETSQARPRWPGAGLLLAGIGLYCAGLLTASSPEAPVRWALATVPLVLLALWFGLRGLSHLWWPGLLAAMRAHDEAVAAIPERHLGRWIVLASALGLFVELMLIRWHGSMFQLFAIYKNVSLLAAFLGLGLGYARGDRRPLATPLVLPAVCLQFVVLYGLSQTVLHDLLQNPVLEQGAMGLAAAASASRMLVIYGFLLLVFALTVLTCLPLGQLAARLMNRQAPLVAYSANLVGSLAGIAAFTALAFVWSPPAVWLITAGLAMAPVLALGAGRWSVTAALVSVALPLVVMAVPLRVDFTYHYSPYQVLTLEMRRGDTPELRANHAYFQRIFDLSPDAQQKYPERRETAAYYELPYFFQPEPDDVLIVGSGTGNDVAAALRSGSGRVDAVEIDPAILHFGELLHPEDPYGDPRVSPIVEDARTFIRRTGRSYDLIVYGLLDSHSQLSNLSSVRLDSFVYTVESFREARARLKPGGLMVMTFSLVSREQGRKMFDMIRDAFDGKEPRVYGSDYDGGTSYVIGETMPEIADAPVREVTSAVRAITKPVDVSTDDWPFLYMTQRTYPVTYVAVIALLLGVSWVLIRELLPGGASGFLPVPFFLGAGFMLVETKSITELGLTLGNTWQVISAAIAGILTMSYLANRVILRWGRMSEGPTYGLLGAALLLGLVVTSETVAGLPPTAARLAMVVVLTLPLFFSGFAFSSEVARLGTVSQALSSNLFGAMVGGFLEYNSMYFGFRSLSLFALVVYGLAFVFARRRA